MPSHISRNLALVAVAAALFSSACGNDAAAPVINSNPDAARLVYDDIPRFWVAFDKIRFATDTIPLRVDYLDRATPGLQDFTEARWRNAAVLTSMVWPRRTYYESIRANTLDLTRFEAEIRTAFRAARLFRAGLERRGTAAHLRCGIS